MDMKHISANLPPYGYETHKCSLNHILCPGFIKPKIYQHLSKKEQPFNLRCLQMLSQCAIILKPISVHTVKCEDLVMLV